MVRENAQPVTVPGRSGGNDAVSVFLAAKLGGCHSVPPDKGPVKILRLGIAQQSADLGYTQYSSGEILPSQYIPHVIQDRAEAGRFSLQLAPEGALTDVQFISHLGDTQKGASGLQQQSTHGGCGVFHLTHDAQYFLALLEIQKMARESKCSDILTWVYSLPNVSGMERHSR